MSEILKIWNGMNVDNEKEAIRFLAYKSGYDIDVVASIVDAARDHPFYSNAAIASITGVDKRVVDNLRDDKGV